MTKQIKNRREHATLEQMATSGSQSKRLSNPSPDYAITLLIRASTGGTYHTYFTLSEVKSHRILILDLGIHRSLIGKLGGSIGKAQTSYRFHYQSNHPSYGIDRNIEGMKDSRKDFHSSGCWVPFLFRVGCCLTEKRLREACSGKGSERRVPIGSRFSRNVFLSITRQRPFCSPQHLFTYATSTKPQGSPHSSRSDKADFKL
jgi:hypothetical protein